ncbi:MAG: hypothetical protein ACOY93_17805 [Bacillota bacterium]
MQNPIVDRRDTQPDPGFGWPTIALVLRFGLFLALQAITALLLVLAGEGTPWQAAAAWWPIHATLTNLICFFLLGWLIRREGISWSALINLDLRREVLGKDLLALAGILLLCGPVAMVPNFGLAQLLFGDMEGGVALFIQPLPMGVALASAFLFPLTQSIGELPTYFGYAMPRLALRWQSPWKAILICAFWLGAQHLTLPLLFDGRFMLWRLGSFLPFALLLAWAVHWRPRLLPYFLVIHALIDLPVGLMVWQAALP